MTATSPEDSELREQTRRSVARLISIQRGGETWNAEDYITAGNILVVCSRLIKQREEQVRQETINRVANTDFVYEVMNAPTNGAAVEWIRSHLSLTSKKTKGE